MAGRRLKDAPEAKNQIAFADVILLNKVDLVSPGELEEVEARIRAHQPYAKLHRTTRCAIDLDAVLGRNAFDLDRMLELEPEFLTVEEHDHDHHGHHRHDHHGHEHHGHEHHDECGRIADMITTITSTIITIMRRNAA